jgi:uncharacterized protein (DUF2235 family)
VTTHIVCLDGTGQTYDQANPTNVAKIYTSVGGAGDDAGSGSRESGTDALTAKYLPGVGTDPNAVLGWLGKLFGQGIAEPIVRGYTFLSRNYSAGNDIIIVGFSRGAAAARALAAFVLTQGLLNPANYDVNDKNAAYLRAIAAWDLYRPKNPTNVGQGGLFTSITDDIGEQLPELGEGDFIAVPQINAVGVFDTVSSVGVPEIDNGDARFAFNISPPDLDPRVLNGFHALAADEARDIFAPTYWTSRDGVIQVIFPGAHSNVGGGYPERGLSDGALQWMLDRLNSVANVFNATANGVAINPNALDTARDDSKQPDMTILPTHPRQFPVDAPSHVSVAKRWGQVVTVIAGATTTAAAYAASGVYAGGRALIPSTLPHPN